MSSGLRYLVPAVPTKLPMPEVLQREEKERIEEVHNLVVKQTDQEPKVSSMPKPVFGSRFGQQMRLLPTEPIPFEQQEPTRSEIPQESEDYPNAPIFPSNNDLVSPIGDWGRQEDDQARMNRVLRMMPRYWSSRFDQHAPKGIF